MFLNSILSRDKWDLLSREKDIASFPANEEATLKTKQPIRFRGLFKVVDQIAGKCETKSIMWQILQLLFPKLFFFPQKNSWVWFQTSSVLLQ